MVVASLADERTAEMFEYGARVRFGRTKATVTGRGVTARGDHTAVLDVKGKLVFVSGSDLYRVKERRTWTTLLRG